jgi:uncharacterized protein DUF3891
MILRPQPAPSTPAGARPAWTVVERTQREHGPSALITQPDHAKLAGEIASAFDRKCFPLLDDDIALAIARHDEGWAWFDRTMLEGKMQRGSFVEAPVADFINAWTGSIDAAENVSPAGGIIVSSHFARLGGSRLSSDIDTGADHAALETFLAEEATRRERLHKLQRLTTAQLEGLTDVLQFCDLLSLYLCCGARDAVEFPQDLGGGPIRAEWRDAALALTPTPLARPLETAVSVHDVSHTERVGLTLV